MFDDQLTAKAIALIDLCRRKRLLLASAESCTGGLVAGLITSVAGSSDVFDAGFVTYSNDAKTRLIGVPADLIASVGAVSREVAEAMARGALAHSRAHIAMAVTGVAGPGGGSVSKPVGLVHCAIATQNNSVHHAELRLGDIGREAVRLATVARTIGMAYEVAAALP